jgi:hypothetical protein
MAALANLLLFLGSPQTAKPVISRKSLRSQTRLRLANPRSARLARQLEARLPQFTILSNVPSPARVMATPAELIRLRPAVVRPGATFLGDIR